MRWADALDAVLQRLRADETLTLALDGGELTRAGIVQPPEVPGITYRLAGSWPLEGAEAVLVEWEIRATGEAQALAIEERMRTLLHTPLAESWGGVALLLERTNARDAAAAAPAVLHRVLSYKLTVAEEQ